MDFENYHHTQQLTFFSLLTKSGYRHRRGHPPAFLILSYSDKRCRPAVHALPLLNLQSFTTSQPERNGCECPTSGGKFHPVEHFPSFFIRGFNFRDLHIFWPVLRSFQQIPIPAKKMRQFPCGLSLLYLVMCLSGHILTSKSILWDHLSSDAAWFLAYWIDFPLQKVAGKPSHCYFSA